MRKILLVGLCLVNFYGAYAQNKTLGVGVATPNPNAALHVESPGGNQGFILPRLTTVQRLATGFTSVLTASDNGLMVYDTNLKTIFIWNGLSWQTTGQVAGGINLTYPYKDSVTVATGTNDLFALKYNYPEGKRIMRIENQSTTNGSSALSVYTNGTGIGAYVQAANPASTSSALYVTTNSDAGGAVAPVAIYGESTGTGSLGASFRINNATNNFPALFAETTGTGSSITAVTSTGFTAIQGEATGGFSNGVTGISRSPEVGSFAVLGSNSGGGAAGVFNINNATNNSFALEATTNGLGRAAKFTINNASSGAQAMLVESNGTGPLAFFRRTNTTSSQPALYVDAQSGGGIRADIHGGSGYAGIFQNVNTANTTPALYAETIGTGTSIWALKSTDAVGGDAFKAENWIATGSAGSFSLTDANNPSPAIAVTTAGTGAAIRAYNEGTGNGFAGEFSIGNSLNQYPAIQASSAGPGSGVRVMQTTGTGAGVDIFMQNTSSPAAGLVVDQQGLGAAINARHTGSTSGDALYAEHAGTGSGSAGNFRISNSSNNASAVYAATNGTGPAIGSSHDSKGIAFAIWSGGIQITTEVITASSITNRASAYRITGGGTAFTLDFGPVNGEVFLIINETGQTITISGGGTNITLLNGEGKTFIMFPGALRAF